MICVCELVFEPLRFIIVDMLHVKYYTAEQVRCVMQSFDTRDTDNRRIVAEGLYGSFIRQSPSSEHVSAIEPSSPVHRDDVRERQRVEAAEEGVYVISVAAKLLRMHPQTLRKYERVGLVIPNRSIGMLRLYSAEDIVRLRLIKYMVDDIGMNLAGVEFALNFLNKVMGLRQMIQSMAIANAAHALLAEEVEQVLRDIGIDFSDSKNS